ncbi:MAG: hypothetical protein M3Q03_03655 [Chloroflexota bacterium]|nr:hypothetical protein [Chloroflexota bacterium]
MTSVTQSVEEWDNTANDLEFVPSEAQGDDIDWSDEEVATARELADRIYDEILLLHDDLAEVVTLRDLTPAQAALLERRDQILAG